MTTLLELLRSKADITHTKDNRFEYLHLKNGTFIVKDDNKLSFEWYDLDYEGDEDDDDTYFSSIPEDFDYYSLEYHDEYSLIIKFGDRKFEFVWPRQC